MKELEKKIVKHTKLVSKRIGVKAHSESLEEIITMLHEIKGNNNYSFIELIRELEEVHLELKTLTKEIEDIQKIIDKEIEEEIEKRLFTSENMELLLKMILG